MTMNILFWNLRGNNVTNYVSQCLMENQVDIAIFAEYGGLDWPAFALNTKRKYHIAEGFEEKYAREAAKQRMTPGKKKPGKVILLVSHSLQAMTWLSKKRYVLYKVACSDKKYILAGIHLQDRRNSDSDERIETIKELVADINVMEQETECGNIIIMGDFNANPYDRELLMPYAFNAVLFKDVLRSNDAIIRNRKKYRRFYNPVLHFLSENTKNYGSFYRSTGMYTPVWYCLDQILVSKPLIDSITDLRYLRNIDEAELLKRLKPDALISDHLPLLVCMKEGSVYEI